MIHARYNREKIHSLPPIPEHTSCDWSINSAYYQRKDGRKRNMSNVAQLPKHYYDSSLVNKDRQQHGLMPLKRSKFLENLAALQARVMASKCNVEHSAKNIQELQSTLHSPCVGENVQSGSSMAAMHSAMSQVLLQNVLGDFHEYGVATAKGSDGKVYMCQLFRTSA